jgi:hypothetical protein
MGTDCRERIGKLTEKQKWDYRGRVIRERTQNYRRQKGRPNIQGLSSSVYVFLTGMNLFVLNRVRTSHIN